MFNKRLFKSIMSVILVFFIIIMNFSFCFATENEATEDGSISSYASYNGNESYGSYIKSEQKSISIDAKKYNFPDNLMDYNSFILFRITYLKDTLEVTDCKVIDRKTKAVISDLSKENLDRLYIGTIVEKTWSSEIKLSELQEGKTYKYTTNSTVNFPEIINDTGKYCYTHISQKGFPMDDEILTIKEFKGEGSINFNQYDANDYFTISYETVTIEEILELIDEDEIIFLSDYNDGDEIDFGIFVKFIYNDTDKDITIITKDNVLNEQIEKSQKINKNEICNFDSFIDSAFVSYQDANTNDNSTPSPSPLPNHNGYFQEDANKQYEGEIYTKLPKAGLNYILLLGSTIFLILIIILKIKLRKYKEI